MITIARASGARTALTLATMAGEFDRTNQALLLSSLPNARMVCGADGELRLAYDSAPCPTGPAEMAVQVSR